MHLYLSTVLLCLCRTRHHLLAPKRPKALQVYQVALFTKDQLHDDHDPSDYRAVIYRWYSLHNEVTRPRFWFCAQTHSPASNKFALAHVP